MTEDQKKIISQAEALRVEVGKRTGREKSDREWAGSLKISPTTWSRLKSGTFKGNWLKQTLEVQKACASIRQLYVTTTTWRPKKFFQFPDFLLLKQAVERAVENGTKRNIKRLAWYLAPQGCGKTQFGRELCEEFNGVWIVARQSWKDSYFSALISIARAIGITDSLKGTGEAEGEILARLNLSETPPVLFFDEPEYFGKPVMNLLKTLLNETSAVIVMLCQPKFYEDTRIRGGIHAAQLLRRSVAVIAMKPIGAADAAQFLKAEFPDEPAANLRACAGVLAAQAALSGGYDACQEIADSLRVQELELTPENVRLCAQHYHQTVGHVAA